MVEVAEDMKGKRAKDFGKQSCKVLEWEEDGIKRLILNFKGSYFTQCLGIPKDHPLAGFHYKELPISCHGGLTFSSEGDGETYPKDFYWYCWDYGWSSGWDKNWALKEVIEDGDETFYDFKLLKEFTKKIVDKRGIL
jgi:hypothetical protein